MEQLTLVDRIFRFRAANHIIREILSYLKPNSKVLDIGSGSGIIAKQIEEKLGVKIALVDVVDKRRVNLPLTIYDGRKLPFENKTFDAALLIFVLHHAEDPAGVLAEAKRVVKDKIIIYEDIITRNPFDKIDSFLHGFAFNKTWNLQNEATFKSEAEWKEIFKKLNLKIVKAYPLPIRARLFYPVYRMQFVLQV